MHEVIDATIPAGWYKALIDHSVKKPQRNGVGHYLQLRFEIIDGQYRGRKVFTRLTVASHDRHAKALGLKRLDAIRRAVGAPESSPSEQLHGVPLSIKVKVRKDTFLNMTFGAQGRTVWSRSRQVTATCLSSPR